MLHLLKIYGYYNILMANWYEVLASPFCDDAVIALTNQGKVFCAEPCELFALTHASPAEYTEQKENHLSTPVISGLFLVFYEVAQ